MSKSRVPGSGRAARQSTLKASGGTSIGEVHRFLGISLGGGKTDKACVAVVEYYPQHHKVFLSRIFEKIKSDEKFSADLKIQEIYDLYRGEFESVAFDVPLTVPLCMQCKLKCPGHEACKEPHIRWMWDYTQTRLKKKRPKKLFTPYTQRAVEMYLATELEEPFIMAHAMGANAAPLLARAHFISRRMNSPCFETFPKLSIWRLGRSLGVMKSHLRFHKHSVGGEESRREILQALSSNDFAFVYEQDVKLMIENNHAFEAFICALTGFLKFKNATQKRPADFPEKETWIEFPIENLKWSKLNP